MARTPEYKFHYLTPSSALAVMYDEAQDILGRWPHKKRKRVRLPSLARRVMRAWRVLPARTDDGKRAIVATCGDEVVAIFRYDDRRACGWSRRAVINAAGTWVAPAHRGQGLGARLWASALRKSKAQEVHVTVISRSGSALVKKMKSLYPRLCWDIDFHGHMGNRPSPRWALRANY